MSDNLNTERHYYDHNSDEPFMARILECRKEKDNTYELILDKTIFYPEGGGQPSDRGTIRGLPILDVIEKNGEILHIISGNHGDEPETGSWLEPTELVLDSRRRRDFSQLHTGQHILSAVILSMTGAATVSMHLGDDNSTIDIETPEMDKETLLKIEDKVADIIEKNIPVRLHLCPPEDISSFPLRKAPPDPQKASDEVIRIINIEGCDLIACCGTHVRSTAEVGLLRVYSAEKYKGMTRIYFSAGRRLLNDSRILRDNALMVSKNLSVPLNEIGKGLLDYMEKVAERAKRLKLLEEEAVKIRADALLMKAEEKKAEENAPVITESFNNYGIKDLIDIGKYASKQAVNSGVQAVFILASEEDLKFAAFSTIKDQNRVEMDLKTFLKKPFEKWGDKGGGGASSFQGSFKSRENLASFLKCFT